MCNDVYFYQTFCAIVIILYRTPITIESNIVMTIPTIVPAGKLEGGVTGVIVGWGVVGGEIVGVGSVPDGWHW